MIIQDIQSREWGDKLEISALVDNFRLWYRLPAGCAYCLTADPFLAAAFFPASRHGETVTVDSPIGASPRLQKGLHHLQEIFTTWRKDLSRFAIEVQDAPTRPVDRRVCSFFSGGVDSVYTLSLHQEEITDLVYINGFDFQMSEAEFATNLARIRRIADLYGKTVTPIETNFWEFNAAKGTGRIWSHGSCLASVALLLGCARCYIPNSYPYTDLRPWGTHPLTDHLWSTEQTDVVHDSGALGRAEKIQAIARKPAALEKVVVCWNLSDRNCGVCEKCLRTTVTLSLLNISTETFPTLLTPEEIAKLSPPEHEKVYTRDNIELAKKLEATAMQHALESTLKRSAFKEIIRHVDELLSGGAVLGGFRRLRTQLNSKVLKQLLRGAKKRVLRKGAQGFKG